MENKNQFFNHIIFAILCTNTLKKTDYNNYYIIMKYIYIIIHVNNYDSYN